MQKKDYYFSLFKENLPLMRCPKCTAGFHMKEQSLVCTNGHCYDLAGKGYLYCMAGAAAGGGIYDHSLFQARQAIFQAGFFTPLLTKVKEILSERFHTNLRSFQKEDFSQHQDSLQRFTQGMENIPCTSMVNWYQSAFVIGDMGCGEGSPLDFLMCDINPGSIGIGIDIAKEGIRLATSRPPCRALWLVADLTRLPLENQSLNVIFNMLSPAHYGEFDRVLRPDGLIIKIVPHRHYLQEMRRHFYPDESKSQYVNTDTVAHFMAHYPKAETMDIIYTAPTDENFLHHLALMSPLTEHITPEDVEAFSQSGITSITAAFTMLLGQKV